MVLIISVSLYNLIYLKTQVQQNSQKDHSQGSNTDVMTTLVCIPYPSLIKGHSVCYTIVCHMQDLGILNHAVCSWSQASECCELNTVNAAFESIILALFFSYDWIMNVSGIIKVGMDWKSALFCKCMLKILLWTIHWCIYSASGKYSALYLFHISLC